MFDFFRNVGQREYPTWNDGPAWDRVNDDMGTIGGDMRKVLPVEIKENYRVGATANGMTTLTLMENALTMTLTLNQAGCEQLIRMLRATYVEEEPTENTE